MSCQVKSCLVETVRHGLKVDGGGGDALLVGHEPVGEMAAVGQVEPHDAVVRLQDGGVHGEVGRRARERLAVDAPFGCAMAG